MKYYDVAHDIYETPELLNNGWGEHSGFKKLSRAEQIVVSRLVNNWIRQDYY